MKKVFRATHAGVALVAASIIEEDLRAAIRARMRKELSKGEEDRLFERGPLATLASRIDMAYALGIISAGPR